MNERIRELRNESEKWVADNFSTDKLDPYEWWEKEEQKFAELIVRECVGVCESMSLIGPYKEVQDATLKDAVIQIKEHFGVEE